MTTGPHVHLMQAIVRRRLDQQLAGFGEITVLRPPHGWIRTIRQALGMSGSDLACRLGVTVARVSQLERAEVKGSIRLSSLGRAAEMLNCQLSYVFVPHEPLEQMVWQRALDKASEMVAWSTPLAGPEDEELLVAVTSKRVEALAHELVDRRGLWQKGGVPSRAESRATCEKRPDQVDR